MKKKIYKLCRNCYNCKRTKGKVHCKEGFFKDKNEKDIKTLIPEEFECFYFEEA